MSFRRSSIKTEIYDGENWIPFNFEDLDIDMIFRTYNLNNELNTDSLGHTIFKVDKKANSENGFTYTVDCHPYLEII